MEQDRARRNSFGIKDLRDDAGAIGESGVKLMTPRVQTRRAQSTRFWHGQAEQKSATALPGQLDGQDVL